MKSALLIGCNGELKQKYAVNEVPKDRGASQIKQLLDTLARFPYGGRRANPVWGQLDSP